MGKTNARTNGKADCSVCFDDLPDERLTGVTERKNERINDIDTDNDADTGSDDDSDTDNDNDSDIELMRSFIEGHKDIGPTQGFGLAE